MFLVIKGIKRKATPFYRQPFRVKIPKETNYSVYSSGISSHLLNHAGFPMIFTQSEIKAESPQVLSHQVVS